MNLIYLFLVWFSIIDWIDSLNLELIKQSQFKLIIIIGWFTLRMMPSFDFLAPKFYDFTLKRPEKPLTSKLNPLN